MILAAAATLILAAEPGFQAASIRPAAVTSGREGGNRSRIQHTPTSLSMWNVDLKECVQWAYDVAPFQISAGRLTTGSYDILAKTEAPVPLSELRRMLQDLLAGRFQLGVHRESRMLPVYELVAVKGGPRLPPSKSDPSQSPVRAGESLPRLQDGGFLFSDASMPEFARMLSQLRGIDLPVVDRTGIPGTFDILLKGAPDAAREGDTAGLFAILQSQSGLKLQPAKAPFDVIVIDHAEKPSAN